MRGCPQVGIELQHHIQKLGKMRVFLDHVLSVRFLLGIVALDIYDILIGVWRCYKISVKELQRANLIDDGLNLIYLGDIFGSLFFGRQREAALPFE